jgi:hypothetical protein
MALADRKLDIETDGVSMQNRIVEPAVLLSDDPHMLIALTSAAFDHLLGRIRKDGEMVFSFKARADGFMLDSEAKIEAIGYKPGDAKYYASILIL